MRISDWSSDVCSSDLVSPTVLANARMLGMNERQLMRHVYWPAALTWMFSSLHTSVGFALIGAVVGEYLGSAAGLGYKIQEAESMSSGQRRVGKECVSTCMFRWSPDN